MAKVSAVEKNKKRQQDWLTSMPRSAPNLKAIMQETSDAPIEERFQGPP